MPDAGRLLSPLRLCVRCGRCLPVCPVYRITRQEQLSPRGRMALAEGLLSGGLTATERMGELVYRCLLCAACREACPRGTPTVDLIAAGREMLAGEGHIRPLARLAFAAARAPRGVKEGILSGVRAFQRILFSRLPGESGLRLRFAGRWGVPEKILPRIPERSLASARGVAGPYGAGGSGNVGIFAGCMANHLLPEIGAAVMEAVEGAGMTPLLPREQECCGLLFWGEGETETARRLAAANARLLLSLPVEAVVVPCSSCLSAFVTVYPELLAGDRELAARWRTLLPRLFTFTQFMRAKGVVPGPVQGGITVTVHDPCHLAHHLGVRREPREFLGGIPGVTLVEMAHPDRCCGSGGLFGALNPELSAQIGDAKASEIAATGAEAVVTECPGCILQIGERLALRGGGIRVLHPAQLAVAGGAVRLPHKRQGDARAAARGGG